MNLIALIVTLLVFTAVFYLIWRFVTDGLPKTILLVFVGVICLVWLMTFTGVTNCANMRIK
jgi:hypothetical protein